jgi:hypothetical protein
VANPTGAGDGAREQRHYYAQNWRADVAVIVDNAGDIQEWDKYRAYGVPFLLTPGDHDKDGDVDAADSTAYTGDFNFGNSRADLNKDGAVNSSDQTLFTASHNAAVPGGRYKLSASALGNRKGYAGYEHEGFGNNLAVPELAHVSNRVLHFGLGRVTNRLNTRLLEYTLAIESLVRPRPGLCSGAAGRASPQCQPIDDISFAPPLPGECDTIIHDVRPTSLPCNAGEDIIVVVIRDAQGNVIEQYEQCFRCSGNCGREPAPGADPAIPCERERTSVPTLGGGTISSMICYCP